MTVTVPPLAPVVAQVEVVHVQRLCPSFVRVTFGGAALADFGVRGPLLDQRIKLVLPSPGSPPPAVDLAHPDGWYAAWLALPPLQRDRAHALYRYARSQYDALNFAF